MLNDTFLEKAPGIEKQNRRASWSGMVLLVSEIESDDPIVEFKKVIINANRGKTVLFNPESAYSLNIDDYPEIWVMHIDGFLTFDQSYDIRKINQRLTEIRAKIDVR